MKHICRLLITVFLVIMMPAATLAKTDFTLYLYDDFETIDVGRHPLYKDGYWSGDTLRTSYCCYMDAVRENGGSNKMLRIHSLGAGENIGSAGCYIYAYLKGINDDIVIEFDFLTETDDTVFSVDMRGATASDVISIFNAHDGDVSAGGRKIADIETGEKYNACIVLHAKSMTMDVTAAGQTETGIRFSAPLITDLQTLRFGMTGSTDVNKVCAVDLDNVKVYQSSEKKPDSAFAETPQQLGLEDWSDLTAFFENNLCFVDRSTYASVGLKRQNMRTEAYFEDGDVYVPYKFLFENLGIDYNYQYTTSKIRININSKNVLLTLGDGLRLVNGAVYVSLKHLTGYSGYYLTYRKNVAFFGRHLVYFNNDGQADEVERFVTYTQEAREENDHWFPTKAEIKADLDKTSAGVHPRVIATKNDFDRIREQIKTDEVMASWYDKIKREAEGYLSAPPFTYHTTDGQRMDTSVISRFEAMGLVYNVEGGERFVQKAYEDMSTICQYDNWQPQSFIITAGMMIAMSIGYDWFYNGLTGEQRQEISEGMYRLGLDVTLRCYRRQVVPGNTDIETRSMLQWLGDQSNWTAVGNGGAAMIGLALYDDYPEDCIECIWNSLQHIENFYATVEPDGGCTEGPGYWAYSRIYYIDLVASLMSGLGTDYGRYFAGGFNKSAYFPLYLQNEAGSFTFSDSDGYIMRTYMFMFFAMMNNDTGLGYYRKKEICDGLSAPTVYDMLWYRAEFENASSDLPLDYYCRNVETGSFRDTFNNDNSTFFAFHGGSNTANHAHVDGGTWVFHAHGTEWFFDLGKDPLTYNNPNGIAFTANQLYRIRAEGHNCMVFDPDQSPGQSGVFAPVESFYSAPEGGMSILDMSNVYNEWVTEYKRGFMLTDSRTRAVIQDKFTLKKASEFYWFAHTDAQIDINAGGKSAILTKNGRQLAVYLRSTNSSLRFEQMEAVPLSTSPNIVGQADSSMFRKLVIHGRGVTSAEIAVSLIPIVKGEDIPRINPPLVPLSEWSITDKTVTYPMLDNVYIDGEQLNEFTGRIFEYTVRLPFEKTEIPEITYDVAPAYNVSEETYEENLMTIKKLTVSDNITGLSKKYFFTFQNMPTTDIPEDIKEIKVESVSASEIIQSEYPPELLIDGSLDNESRWTGINDQWVLLDLGKEYDVDGFALAIFKGNERQNKFEVYTSTDNSTFEIVLDSSNSKKTDGLEAFRVKKTTARYIKVQFHGADATIWNSIKEIKIYGQEARYSVLGNVLNENFN